MSPRSLCTPPPEDKSASTTTVEYTKKARHGHGKDVTDAHDIRQVAGCLPIDPASKRFILVSSSKNPEAWVIPKGGWETDETQEQAALRETWEEAGIKGHITHQLGVFVERANRKIKAHHWIFEMEIDEIVKKYPERKRRDRRWFTYEEALLATANNPYIQEAIRLSSISPLPRRPSLDGGMNQHAPKLEATPKKSLPSFTPSTPKKLISTIESPSILESKISNDAFQALQELMEKTAITA